MSVMMLFRIRAKSFAADTHERRHGETGSPDVVSAYGDFEVFSG
jgi:hypothetical protein